MILRQIRQCLGQHQRVPAEAFAPHFRGKTSLRIGPLGHVAAMATFKVTVKIQTRITRLRAAGKDRELPGDFIPAVRGIPDGFAVARHKHFAHEHAVNPHLPVHALVVPEPAVAIAGIGVQRTPDFHGGQFITFVMRLLIHHHERIAGHHVVEIAEARPVGRALGGEHGQEVPVGIHELVEVTLGVIEIPFVAGGLIEHFKTAQRIAVHIRPAIEVGFREIRPAGHDRVRERHGPELRCLARRVIQMCSRHGGGGGIRFGGDGSDGVAGRSRQNLLGGVDGKHPGKNTKHPGKYNSPQSRNKFDHG